MVIEEDEEDLVEEEEALEVDEEEEEVDLVEEDIIVKKDHQKQYKVNKKRMRFLHIEPFILLGSWINHQNQFK